MHFLPYACQVKLAWKLQSQIPIAGVAKRESSSQY